MPSAFDINLLNREPDLVAVLVQAGDVFSFRIRQVIVPQSCAALVWDAAPQPRLARPGSAVESGDARELLFVRTTPFALRFAAQGLNSRDGYEFAAMTQAAVQVIPERTELASFQNALLGGGASVRAGDLQRYCEAAVRAALFDLVSTHDASALLAPAVSTEFEPILAERFRPLGFESGLMLGGDVRLTLESPDFARTRQAEQAAAAHRKRQEAEEQLLAAANQARAKHLHDLSALLDQARNLAEKANTGLIEIIKTHDPARRGAMYEGLIALNRPTAQTTAILVAAGNELIVLDPFAPEEPKARLNLSAAAGPLRSIRLSAVSGRTVLLIGARSGVHVVDAGGGFSSGQTHLLIFDWPIEPTKARGKLAAGFSGDRSVQLANQASIIGGAGPLRHGFNAAVVLGERLYATHSEVGLVQWPLAATAPSEQCLPQVTEGAKSVRDVQDDDSGRLLFAVDNRVISWLPGVDTEPTVIDAHAPVNALAVADGFVYAGLADGRVACWPVAGAAEARILREAGQAVGSLAWLGGGGVPRLLIADGRPHLDLLVLGDAYRGEYCCDQPVRWGFAADDWIVGVNDRRDRLFVWPIDQPQRPSAVVSVRRLCGHSIQDVAMLSQP